MNIDSILMLPIGKDQDYKYRLVIKSIGVLCKDCSYGICSKINCMEKIVK